MMDLTKMVTGNCDVDESPVLPVGHYVIRSNGRMRVQCFTVTTTEHGEVVATDSHYTEYPIPAETCVQRFHRIAPFRLQVRCPAGCDWYIVRAESEEQLDLTPVEVPLELQKPLPLREELMRFIETKLSCQADGDGYESIDEADDLDVDDEVIDFFGGITPYEMVDDEDAEYYNKFSDQIKQEISDDGTKKKAEPEHSKDAKGQPPEPKQGEGSGEPE